MQEIKYTNVLYVFFVNRFIGRHDFAFISYTLFPSVRLEPDSINSCTGPPTPVLWIALFDKAAR